MTMLFLLRHAKAATGGPGMRDFDRPLAPRGVEEARIVAAAFAARYAKPDVVLCSPALRTRETWQIFARVCAAPAQRTLFPTALYDGDVSDYGKLIEDAWPQQGSLLVVGHNPMTKDFARRLAGSGDPKALSRIASGFPTSGLAVLSLEKPSSVATAGSASLEAFLTPEAL